MTSQDSGFWAEAADPVWPQSTMSAALGYAINEAFVAAGESSPALAFKYKEPSIRERREKPLYEVAPIPGKGLGAVAKTRIHRGQLVMVDTPLVRVTGTIDEDELQEQFDTLSDEQQKQFLALHNIREDPDRLMGIIWINAIPLDRRATEAGLFPQASRINHSCSPNTNHSWDPKLGVLKTYAIRDIKFGEEVTSTYLNNTCGELANYAERQQHLKRHFDFDCCCSVCALPFEGRLRSDLRINMINRTRKALLKMSAMSYPKGGLRMVFRLLLLYDRESIVDRRPGAIYQCGFLVACRLGYWYEAGYLAEQAARIFAEVEGERSIAAEGMRQCARETREEGKHESLRELCG